MNSSPCESAKKLRIAYISFEYPPDSCHGGIATYVAQAASMMTARGHDVEVFAASPWRNESVTDSKPTVHWIKETNRDDFGIVASYVFCQQHAIKPFDVIEGPEFQADARKIRELNPDIALVVRMHTPWLKIMELNHPFSASGYFKSLCGSIRKLASSIAANRWIDPFEFSSTAVEWGRKMDRLERAHAREADLVVAPCYDLCHYAVNRWAIPESRVRHSPYPYDPDVKLSGLVPTPLSNNVVGFVGRLERRKGIEILTAAIPRILNIFPETKFRFVGGSSLHPETGVGYDVWIAKKLSKFADSIDIVGKVPLADISDVYSGLSICVFPSMWENFPNVCLEAMAAGKAIVATKGGGMQEMLADGNCGLLVEPGDAKALANAICGLLGDKKEQLRYGSLARERVLKSYDSASIGTMIESIFYDAIAMKRG